MSDSRWKAVPLDATETMADESASVRVGSDGEGGCWIGPEDAEDLWGKMLAAAPPFAPSEAHVEAVARALCVAAGHDPDATAFKIGPYYGFPANGPQWRNFAAIACAAISALVKAMEQS